MAQLSDDCFAFGGDLLSIGAALALLEAQVTPQVASETVPLREARGRILAAPLVAPRDVPPHDNSAVDGYAVFFRDLAAGELWRTVTSTLWPMSLHQGLSFARPSVPGARTRRPPS